VPGYFFLQGKIAMRKLMICKLLLLFLFVLSVSFAATPEYVYVSATNVRIRDTAATSGNVVATLPLGTWGKVLAVSDKTETLLGKTAPWYKISTDTQQEGWIFGGLTQPASQDERFSAALQIVQAQTSADKKSAEDLMQTLAFVETIKEMASHSLEKAQLELAFLVTLDRVYSALSMAGKGADSKHKAVASYQNLCYYHEPAGQHFVKPETFWELAEKYADIVEAAEEIAWAAATQTLPGETEGDPDMMIYFYEKSYGRYIESYPEGKHFEQALEAGVGIIDYVAENMSYYEKAEDKANLKKKLIWFVDLASVKPESNASKKMAVSMNKIADRLRN
jgi:hypothetical protein